MMVNGPRNTLVAIVEFFDCRFDLAQLPLLGVNVSSNRFSRKKRLGASRLL
jgi:hypothetical protein